MKKLGLCLVLFFSSCAHKQKPSHLLSLQLVDRNGQTETISQIERVKLYEKQNFDKPQSYEKILRVYSKNEQGKNPSLITTYHKNGQLFQKLQALDGRAYGTYEEYFENGRLRIKASVIEGTADITDLAQSTWVFDGACHVYYPSGHLEAIFGYDRGKKSGSATYFHENGLEKKKLHFIDDAACGQIQEFSDKGVLYLTYEFKNGSQTGPSSKYYESGGLAYEELWQNDTLIDGKYYNNQGVQISSISQGYGLKTLFDEEKPLTQLEYKKGRVCGKIIEYDSLGKIQSYYHIEDDVKTGEEGIFFEDSDQLKMLIDWHCDQISGIVKTFYKSGVLESQKTFSHNKKNGPLSCYYPDGSLMLLETYSQDRLVEGKYFKKSESEPASMVEDGTGCATLFDEWGGILKQVHYEKGKVVLNDDYCP
jgi:antitoxin component YwqK of YwqJK toxin-antitoxin module